MCCRTIFFGEYECFGEGANYTSRVPYGKQLQEYDAASFMDVSYIDGDQWLQHHDDVIVSPQDQSFIQSC